MRLKKILHDLITKAVETARAAGELSFDTLPAFDVEAPKQAGHGDLATNLALVLAKQAKLSPRKVAEILVSRLAAPADMLKTVEIAGPGFINFFIADAFWYRVISEIHELGPAYGDSDLGAGQKVQVEFVSANPTGPLHIGHGRGAALGDVLANLLAATGHEVVREYYINDVGNQILTLGKSLYFRLREHLGEVIEFPEDGYQGGYMKDLAREYLAQGHPAPPVPAHEDDLRELGRYAGDAILAEIKQDLEDFGVRFDVWFSETELYRQGLVEKGFELLKGRGFLYEQDGALWFKATEFGDEKDRVVRRSNGATTYFASDVAYHMVKFQQGFDLVVDIWGADHHGYVPRLQAAAQALGFQGQLKVILVQLVSLLRQGLPVAMTTRGGTFVTLGRFWTKWVRMRPASSFSPGVPMPNWSSTWTWPSSRAARTRSIMCSMPTPVWPASSVRPRRKIFLWASLTTACSRGSPCRRSSTCSSCWLAIRNWWRPRPAIWSPTASLIT